MSGPCVPVRREFLQFLRAVDRCVPKALQIRVISDSDATHTHADDTQRLAKHAPFHLQVTPTSSPWCNMAEQFFGKATDKTVCRGAVHSVPALVAAIGAHLEAKHSEPGSFMCTATTEQILKQVRRGPVVLQSPRIDQTTHVAP